MNFRQALRNRDMDQLRRVPKSDLHNHFVLGGNREYIRRTTGVRIDPIVIPLTSMDEMHQWNNVNMGGHFDNPTMRKLLIDATLVQAKADGVTVLEIGEDVWGLAKFFSNDIAELISTFHLSQSSLYPEVELRLQIGMSRHCPIDYLMLCLDQFWGRTEFYSIDLYGDELSQPIKNFVPIYRMAKENGLVLKAHIGEWGTADDVIEGVELLELDEVQHGIAAAQSRTAVRYLRDNGIRLNVAPSSNVLLGRVRDMKRHPISTLHRNGVEVTVNSDDILLCDSDVSKEYFRLYESGCLTDDELEEIRLNGLKPRKAK